MNGEKTLYRALSGDIAVTDLLSIDAYGDPEIIIGVREPETWGVNDKTISIYNAVGVDNRGESLVVELTANCRAGTEVECKQIASAVVTSVNRKAITAGGRFYCQTGGVIIPQDENDSFNIPMTVIIKAVRELE